MRVKVFRPVITSVISKGKKHGTIQVIPMYTNDQLLKQPASLHISYSMRNVQSKRCKRSGIFQKNLITSRCQITAEDNAVRVERAHPTKFCIPPDYYKKSSQPFQAGVSPGICKTAKGNKAWQYSRVDGAVTDEAEAIAMSGVQVPQHPRIKGWDTSDVERRLPVEMKVTDGKLSNFLSNQVFFMICCK